MNPAELSNIFGMPMYVVVIALIWSMAWKGVALWKASRNESKAWFIALLVINTLGILEILYIFVFSKKSVESSEV